MKRFSFIAHLVDESSLSIFDEKLACLSKEERKSLIQNLGSVSGPIHVSTVDIKTKLGKVIRGDFYCLMKTTEMLLEEPASSVVEEIQQVVNQSEINGSSVIGLGGYTSIVSAGGRLLKSNRIKSTTGNSYTIASALNAIEMAINESKRTPDELTVAVVGASGSIGMTLSKFLAQMFKHLVLIGNSGSLNAPISRLEALKNKIYDDIEKSAPFFGEAGPIKHQYLETGNKEGITVSLSLEEGIADVDVLILATSNPTPIVTKEIVKRNAIICDLSVPRNTPRELCDERPDLQIFEGGIIKLPCKENLGWNFGLQQGDVYACMTETMLIALEDGELDYCATPVIKPEFISALDASAKHHGFKLGSLRKLGA